MRRAIDRARPANEKFQSRDSSAPQIAHSNHSSLTRLRSPHSSQRRNVIGEVTRLGRAMLAASIAICTAGPHAGSGQNVGHDEVQVNVEVHQPAEAQGYFALLLARSCSSA